MANSLAAYDTTAVVSSLDRSVPSTGRVAAVATPAWLDIELVTTRAAFDALEADWNALFARAGRGQQLFQSFNWNWHWANVYLDGSPGGIAGLELCIVTGRRDGQLIMVWPLVAQRVRGIRQIFWMGEPVGQYGDALIDDIANADDVLAAGWAFLKRTAPGDVVRLRRVRADAAAATILLQSGAEKTNTEVAPFLDLASARDFADYETRYSPRSRRNRRRLMRRLEDLGPVHFERHHGGAAARDLALTSIALKKEWLADRALVSHALSDPRMARFFAAAAEGVTRPTGCVVSAIIVNGEPAALEVSFACKERLALHVIVFNLKYEKSGAGVLLLEQTVRDGYKEKLGVYDMLAPGDSYKLEWADKTIEVSDWAEALSLTGRSYLAYLAVIRPRLKAMAAQLPKPVRRIAGSVYGALRSKPRST